MKTSLKLNLLENVNNKVNIIIQFYCLLKKKQMMLACAHNRETVPLRSQDSSIHTSRSNVHSDTYRLEVS